MLALRRVFQSTRIALAAAIVCAAVPAHAQSKLDAHYIVTLAGIPIGKGSWAIELGETRYSASATGATTGLMRVLTEGEGVTTVVGTYASSGKVVNATYGSTIRSRKQKDEVHVTLDKGDVKDTRADPPPDHDKERVPVSEADLHNVSDPMTAAILPVPGSGNPLSAEACQHTTQIFDGRLRYELKLAFKRMDTVKAEKGYAGPVVVCAVYFKPVSGYIPSRATIRYLSQQKDMEVWLAPIAGTRMMVPFRVQGPTPIGEAVMTASQFLGVANPAQASANGHKSP